MKYDFGAYFAYTYVMLECPENLNPQMFTLVASMRLVGHFFVLFFQQYCTRLSSNKFSLMIWFRDFNYWISYKLYATHQNPRMQNTCIKRCTFLLFHEVWVVFFVSNLVNRSDTIWWCFWLSPTFLFFHLQLIYSLNFRMILLSL